MRDLINKLVFTCNQKALQVSDVVAKNKKYISFAYMFALLFSLGTSLAFAAVPDVNKVPLWVATQAILDVVYPVLVVIGFVVLVIGVILIFVQKFNEQSITGPIIMCAVGAGLIVIRILLGGTIARIAFNQMYPEYASISKQEFQTLQNNIGAMD